VKGWADDPELIATFRAEVNERLASLCEGLLRLEGDPAPKRLVGGLFRDAHTVKGSAGCWVSTGSSTSPTGWRTCSAPCATGAGSPART
jgi:chemotaxis protein histidine kinase CheA